MCGFFCLFVCVCACKAKPIHSLLPISRWMSSHVLGSSSIANLLGKANNVTMNIPPSSTFPQSLIAEHGITVCYRISLWSTGVTCPGCVPSQPPHWSYRVGKRESLDIVQALFNNSQNSGVLSTLF